MTGPSPNKNEWGCWHSVPFCHFLLCRGEFHFDVVGNFEPKKITSNYNTLVKSMFLTMESLMFPWQCITMLFTNKKACSQTSLECAH